jgi:photosystem II stability/assembly factor-like uncharacterized protein
MRTPRIGSSRGRPGARRASDTATARVQAVPGGKVLARLGFFVRQRADQFGDSAARPSRPRRARRRRARSRKPQEPSVLLRAHDLGVTAPAAAMPVQQAWRPLGPYSVPHGQTYGSGPRSRPSISGRVSSVAVDPGNASHVLAGAAGGGVWESLDAGRTWAPRTDDQPSLAIGAVAFDPTNPAIAYAGTGEGDSTFAGDPCLLGVGLLKSADGGRTWTLHARAPFERLGFFDLAVDPADGRHLLAATTDGLFESKNGGDTWQRRRIQRTWSVSFRPDAATAGAREALAACDDGLFRSTNGGGSWSAVSLPNLPSLERMAARHAPSDGNVAYVFAASASRGFFWRRAVFGGAFTRASLPQDLDVGQAFYDWFLAVAPNNPDVVYLGAIEAHRGVRSPTGQWRWTTISAKPAGDSIHPDQHAIAFSPVDPTVVWIGNDGGVYRSPDAGVTWASLNKGLNVTEIEFLAQHPRFETWLLAGTQDNGTLRFQGDTVWHHVRDGDGGDCGTDFGAPYTCYHSYYGMGVGRSTRGGAWETWTPAPDFIIGPPFGPNDTYPNGSLFYPPLDVNGRVVVQAGRKAFISRNAGAAWTGVALPVVGGEMASAVAASTPSRVYVGTNAGRVFRIDFASGAWQAPAALTRPAAGYLSDLFVDPTNASRLYVSYTSGINGRVFRSDDGGASWIRADAGLPDRLPINAIEIDPDHPETIFAAGDVGVYLSRNAGAAWSPFNNGLPNALVKDILFHPEARLLRAGTQARGVWEIAVDAATMPDVELYLRDSRVDSGRLSPSPSGVDDPFEFGAQAFWWQCTDLKIDAPSFLRPSPADVDFEVFGDDQSLEDGGIEFAAGLVNESPQASRTVRVFVQVHNRGVQPARQVVVKVFFAPASVTFPDLPAGFWANFPNNVVAPASAWQPIAAHQGIAQVAPGRSAIAAFDWAVPAALSNPVALFAALSAENDSIATTETNVAALVRSEKKVGLRNVTVVNPPPLVGPPVLAVPVTVAAPRGSTRVTLQIDRALASLLRGVVVGPGLARAAKQARWKRLKLSEADRTEIARLMAREPSLRKALKKFTAFAPPKGPLLQLHPVGRAPATLALLVRPHPPAGYGSLVQLDASGQPLGGLTLAARGVR